MKKSEKKSYSKFENEYRYKVNLVEHKAKILIILRIILPSYLLLSIYFAVNVYSIIFTSIILVLLLIYFEQLHFKSKIKEIKSNKVKKTLIELND